MRLPFSSVNEIAAPQIYTLSLHDALPISSQDVESAHQRASLSTRIALDDQGFSDIAVADVLAVRCEKQACLTPDSNIWVAVEIPIRVPGIPFIGNGPKIMTASAAQAATVERFRAEP